jgi:hypothetical protein
MKKIEGNKMTAMSMLVLLVSIGFIGCSSQSTNSTSMATPNAAPTQENAVAGYVFPTSKERLSDSQRQLDELQRNASNTNQINEAAGADRK